MRLIVMQTANDGNVPSKMSGGQYFRHIESHQIVKLHHQHQHTGSLSLVVPSSPPPQRIHTHTPLSWFHLLAHSRANVMSRHVRFPSKPPIRTTLSLNAPETNIKCCCRCCWWWRVLVELLHKSQ